MSRKYAIIITDSGYMGGVNGMLNGLWYYDNDVDFHYIYKDDKRGSLAKFMESVKSDPWFADRIYTTRYEELIKEGYPVGKDRPVWRLKFYRYLYGIRRCQDYDAAVIFDADTIIVNNFMRYFDIAAETGRILVPNNDYSGEEFDCYRGGYKGASSPPLYCMPLFFVPSNPDVVKAFERIPELAMERDTSDMVAFNHTMIESKLIDEILLLPAALWLQVHYYFVMLAARNVGGKKYLALHRGGDRLYSFHRRWWFETDCRKKMVMPKSAIGAAYAYNNVKLFWDFTRFFNLECRHKIEWNPRWGGFPTDIPKPTLPGKF